MKQVFRKGMTEHHTFSFFADIILKNAYKNQHL